jgi:Tol biopolymer transport system component/predicted Ser/Thr protein kinase
VSHYEIVSELGRGGMGVVYRARDLDLPREVALKQPWPDFVDDGAVRRRFRREARAAARLMHPNVVPVFEVFREEGRDWLAMELVEGSDLKSLIRERGALPLEEILRHGEALADALHAAHEKGILHRDVNPKNILVDSRGVVRLTDFGLARILPTAQQGTADSTRTGSITSEGSVVGTLNYMSPEQILGKELDARSDLYSLGAVLYEMCTGEPLVTPDERGAVLDAILHHKPKPIARLNYEVPEELERIVRKCLCKRSDERYQDAREIQTDLRALRRQIRSDEIGREIAQDPIRNRLPRLLAAVGIPALAVTLLVAWFLGSRDRGQQALQLETAKQLTSAVGWEGEASLSPDGKALAYVSDAAGNLDIWILDARGGEPMRRTRDPGPDRVPAWTADGSEILYARAKDGTVSIWKTPRFSGPSTLLIPDATDPAPSPDGKMVAFARRDASGDTRIAVAPLEDPSSARLLTGRDDGIWEHRSPAWSPDGSTICYTDNKDLWLVPAGGGEPRRLTEEGAGDIEPAWSSDGRRVYFSSYREGTFALWSVASTGGKPTRLTPGTGPERRPSISRDGSIMAFSSYREDHDIVILDMESGEEDRIGGSRLEMRPAVSPDGTRLAFVSDRWGQFSIAIQPLREGKPDGAPYRVTDHPGSVSAPIFSPDGDWIAYFRVIGGQRDIWIVKSGGGIATQFTDDPGIDVHPDWMPDGRSIAFASDRDGASHIWIRAVEKGRPAGAPRRLTSGVASDYFPRWSPNGQSIAFVRSAGDSSDVWIVDAEGREAPRRLTEGADALDLLWHPTHGTLLVSGFWGDGILSIRSVSIDGDTPRPLDTNPQFGVAARAGDFVLFPDGRKLAYVQEGAVGDLWIVTGRPGSY